MIEVSGTLTDSMGEPLDGAVIRVTATSNTTTLSGIYSEVTTGEDGSYLFYLVEGTHQLEVKQDDELVLLGETEVDSFTGSPKTLLELLE